MYSGGEHMCPADGYICFRNSQLLCGRLGKATLGGGNKAGLFQVCGISLQHLTLLLTNPAPSTVPVPLPQNAEDSKPHGGLLSSALTTICIRSSVHDVTITIV